MRSSIEHYLYCLFIGLLIAIPLNGVDQLIGFNLHVIILAVCFLLWLFRGAPNNRLSVKYVFAQVLLFFAFLLSSHKFYNISYYAVTMNYVQAIMSIVLICQVKNAKEYHDYLQSYIFGALLNSVLILFGPYLGLSILHWGDVGVERVSIFGRDPNEMAMVHCFAIVFALYFLRTNKKKNWMIINSAAAILSVASVLYSGSRTATVAVVLLVLINFIISKKKIGGFAVGLLVTLSLVFTVYYVSVNFLDESVLERYTGMGAEIEEGTMANRTLIWEDCISAFVKGDIFDKLVGNGYNTTPLFTFGGYDAHNVFIKVLIEYGIIGELLFFYIWYFFIKSSMRIKNRDDKFMVISILTMIFISFLTLSWIYNLLIWVVVILIHLKIKYFESPQVVN